MKKSLILFLTSLTVFTLVGCNKNNEEYQLITNNSIKYLVYNGETKFAMVVGFDENLPNEVTIPSTISGYNVNAIRHESFVNSNITKITIPESIAYIGYRSFAECYYLKEVNLPNTITTIYQNTFAECNSLETIKIPDNVTTISTGAFLGCDNLKSINFPSNLNDLQSYVFYDCTYLNNIDLSNTKIDRINEFTFAYCSSLNNIKLNNISSLGSSAFFECTSLSEINLPDTLLSIGDYSFNKCTSLDKIFIPKNVGYIGKEVFSNNKESFKILLGVKEIPTLYNNNFNCYYPYVLGANKDTKIDEVFVTNENINYGINNYDTNEPTASLTYPNETFASSLVIPDSISFKESKVADVVNIADHAFINNDNIQSLSFSSKLKKIGKYALANSSLSSINFNQALEYLDIYCFSGCNNLTSIDLQNTNISNIGDMAFYYDFKLNKVILPSENKNTKLGSGAFYKCRQLKEITNLDKITELDLKGYTFAECYNLGIDINNPFIFSSNIKTLTITDFLDWGTTQNQYIKIAKDAYNIDESSGDVYLTANENTIKLEKTSESTYKNNIYFSNAIITLEPKS